MAKTKAVHRVEVVTDPEVKHISIPPELDLKYAIQTLTRKYEEMETEVEVEYEFDALPLEGAYGLQQVLEERYGFALSTPKQIQTFFGPMEIKPEVKRMQVGPDKYAQVIWGQFQIPNVPGGTFETGVAKEGGDIKFCLKASMKQKHRGEIDAIAEALRTWVRTRSPYRGHALLMQFDSEGKLTPDNPPHFLDVSKVDPRCLVLNKPVYDMLDAVLFGPIQETDLFRRHVNLSRGALFYGGPGTGKTLAAMIAAKLCEENGWTFFYVEDPRQLLSVLRLARRYTPSIVFVEDIDLLIHNRDLDTANRVINEINGITSKHTEVGLVMTSNNVDAIATPLKRPGRSNLVMEFPPPDREAVGRLLRYYAGDALPEDCDISECCAVMEGQIPAAITECVERAKIVALRQTGSATLTPEALLASAKTLVPHLELLKPRKLREGIDYHVHEAAQHIRAIVGSDPTAALERFFSLKA